MIDSDWHLETVRRSLRELAPGRPHQTMLRRAISSLYYALFHEICRQTADLHVGSSPLARKSDRYTLIYRLPEHGRMRSVFKAVQSSASSSIDAQRVAAVFIDLQEARHRADYDPRARFRRAEVAFSLVGVELALHALRSAFADKDIILTRVIARDRV